MPLHHGSLFLRWERWPVRQRCACDASDRPGRASELSLGFRHVGGADGRNLRCVSPAALSTSPPGSSPGRSSAAWSASTAERPDEHKGRSAIVNEFGTAHAGFAGAGHKTQQAGRRVHRLTGWLSLPAQGLRTALVISLASPAVRARAGSVPWSCNLLLCGGRAL